MAISVAWQTVATVGASLGTVFTSQAASTTATFGQYQRDLVINNSGTTFIAVGVGTAATSATTAASFAIPPGGSVILTQCQVPFATAVVAIGPGSCSVGYATNVAYV